MRRLNLFGFVMMVALNGVGSDLSGQFNQTTPPANTTPDYFWNTSDEPPMETFYYYPYMYDNLYSFDPVTWDDVREELNSNKTLTLLSSFNTKYERDIIYNHLLSCPWANTCGLITLEFKTFYLGESCCHFCSCAFPGCLKDMTCCLDILFNNIDAYGVDKDETVDEPSRQEPHCVPLALDPNTVSDSNKYHGALMIDFCPTDTNEDLDKNCTRPYTSSFLTFLDIVPVMSIVSGVMYRNIYCANCHNLHDKDLDKATARVSCQDGQLPNVGHGVLKAVFEEKTCNVLFQPLETYKTESCVLSVVECNTTGDWLHYDANIKKACNLYAQAIFVQNRFYKNPFCAMCNGLNITDLECLFEPGTNQFTFSGLLKLENFNKEGPTNVYVNDGKCTPNQIYDSVLNICRDIICPSLGYLENGGCHEIYSEVYKVVYHLHMKIILANPTTLPIAYQLGDKLVTYLKSLPIIDASVCGSQILCHVRENIMYKTYEEIEAMEMEYYKVRLQIYQKQFLSPYKMYDNLMLLHKSMHTITYFDFEASKQNTFDAYIELVDFDSAIFEFLAKLSIHDRNLTYSSNEPLPLKLVLDTYTISDNHTGSDAPFIKDYSQQYEECPKQRAEYDSSIWYYKKCPKILISEGEPEWVRTDEGIRFVQGNFIVPSSEFFFDFNDNIMICTDIYKEYMSLFLETHMTPMAIVSIVFSSLSVLALLFTFAVFLLIPRLRQYLPGKIHISLVLALLCAQCMYLVCSYAGVRVGSLECAVIGGLLHYFWILSFMWMNISTYHMYHVLTQLKIVSNTPGICRLIVYHAYGAIMAALPVVINIIVSNINSGSSGYGDTQCYISSQIMIVYTFAIPLGLVMIGNACMYVMVVCKIKRAPNVKKSVQNERNDLKIFVKLSTITGATWLFGLIYSWTDLAVMSYISIVLNAGQGVFIMYSLILNRRVLHMFSSDVLGRSSTGSGTRGIN